MPRGDLEATLAHIGDRLRSIRGDRGLTQQQVGERAGFTAKYVSEIERGQRDVPLSTLRSIVERALGAALQDVLASVGPDKHRAGADEAPTPRALPPSVRTAADRIARLPHDRRRKVMTLVRGLLDLAAR